MFFIEVYLIKLFIAPQWWLEPFVGLRVDLILYPVWLLFVVLSQRSKVFFRLTILDRYMIYYVGWLLLSMIINQKNDLSVTFAVEYITWLLMFKLLQATITDFDYLKKVTHFLSLVMFILVVEGIYHKLNGTGIGWAGQSLGWVQREVLAAGGTGRTRWVSIFDGPGVFCIAYTTALPFVMRYLFMPTSKKVKVLSAIFTFLFLLAIYYTGSRGGFLATIAIITLFILYKLKISFIKLLYIGGLLSVLFILAPSHLTNTKDSSKSAQHRVDMWGKGVVMARYHPIIGVGRGNFKRYSFKLIAHNSAINIMAEMGFVGLFFWFCLLYLAFKNLYIFHENTEDIQDKNYSAAIAISLAGYLVNSFFVTAEFETMYMIIAFSAVIGSFNKKALSLSFKEKLWLMCAVASFYILIKVFISLYY